MIDIGVFTGASSLAAALALKDLDPVRANGSVVLACDINDDYTRIAEKYWEKAGVRDYVKLQIAPATETLQVNCSQNFLMGPPTRSGFTHTSRRYL